MITVDVVVCEMRPLLVNHVVHARHMCLTIIGEDMVGGNADLQVSVPFDIHTLMHGSLSMGRSAARRKDGWGRVEAGSVACTIAAAILPVPVSAGLAGLQREHWKSHANCDIDFEG